MPKVLFLWFALWSVAGVSSGSATDVKADLSNALTFHASFDSGAEADFALGEKKLFHAPSMGKRAEAKAGLPESGEVVIAKGEGKYGNALRFKKKRSSLVF